MKREFRNDVMWLAFANVDASSATPVMRKCIITALRRFEPGTYGGWRVVNKRSTYRGKRDR